MDTLNFYMADKVMSIVRLNMKQSKQKKGSVTSWLAVICCFQWGSPELSLHAGLMYWNLYLPPLMENFISFEWLWLISKSEHNIVVK